MTAAPAGVDVPAARELCVTCLVCVGCSRPTVLRSVVCGPCWAAHGGRPAAGEIGPAPAETAPTRFPEGQSQWLRELDCQDWVQAIRVDGRSNLLKVARLVALYAEWDTLETRPTWAKLTARSGLSERTIARWLQELRLHGWLVLLEHGSTPETRPMALAHLQGNRAALYGLRIPITHDEAMARAGERLAAEVARELADESAPDSGVDQRELAEAVDVNVSLPWSCKSLPERSPGGFSHASKSVDNSHELAPGQQKLKTSAHRAGSDRGSSSDLAIMVPVSGFEMLACSDWLRRELGVFGRCSRRLIRHLCRPYWRAGWCNRDIVHAMDHRPSAFSEVSGLLRSPEHVASPAQFIRSRLAAWTGENGGVLPGYWTARRRAVTDAHHARARVRDRHGRAGERLLRAGEHTLTAVRVAEHGRHTRSQPPVPAAQPAGVSPGAQERDARQAARDRRRAQLVAQARAALTQHDTPTAVEQSHPAAEGVTVYERALARARALSHGSSGRRHLGRHLGRRHG